MKPVLLTLLLVVAYSAASSQDFSSTMDNAYLITRMVEKFHIQPRALNNELSNDLFNQVIKKADPERIVFTTEDLDQLNAYRFSLDEEINQRKTGFLQLFTSMWQKRVKQNDSLVQIICKTAFNFSLPEKYSNEEDSSYTTNIISKQKKLYKHIKWKLLDIITDTDFDFSTLQPSKQKQVLDSTETILRKATIQSFQKTYSNSLLKEKLAAGFGNLFCKSLAVCYDPHSVFMPEDEKEEFDEDLGQKPLRFGMMLNENEKGEVTIGKLQPGSSAFKSGALNSGDKIITVQEPGKTAINVTDFSLFQIDSIMNEIKSDKLFLTIKKPDGTIKQTTLYKERFSTEEDEEDKVQGYVLKGTKNIGYISIPDFYIDWENTETGIFGCANDVAKEIIKLKKENIEGLIIDIRYNGGGSVQEAIELSGIFIDGGPVAQYKTKEPKVYTLKDVNSGSVFNGEVMILVNGYSASASEMFSATMQDYNRAIIAGSPTYGKSTGQLIFPLDTTVTIENYKQKKTENYIKITTMALYRVTGATAQQQGVVPDILLPDLLETIGEKEKNEQFAFHLLPVEKNKYYKAYNLINTDEIKRTAQAVMDTSTYFKKLNDYGRWINTTMQQKEFSMRIEDVIEFKKKQQSYINFFESFEQQPSFTVANHSLQKERLKASEWLTEMDEETKLMLRNDPYINICYQLLVKVISK